MNGKTQIAAFIRVLTLAWCNMLLPYDERSDGSTGGCIARDPLKSVFDPVVAREKSNGKSTAHSVHC
jgi:hypothetical protein